MARYRFIRLFFLGAFVVALLLRPGATPVRASGVVTDCSSDTQLSSLLAGGGTVTFNCGTALIDLSSAKTISVDTVIDGGGQIALSGQDATRLFEVSNGAALVLRNIVLTNGYSSGNGGAIHNGSSGSDTPGSVTLENTTIRNSRSNLSGGAIVSTGPLTITNSRLENNQALNGGALYPRFAGARTTIVNSVLFNNRATDTTDGWGGAILAWDGAPVTIAGSDLYSNTARSGGGIYNFANSILTLQSNTLLRNNLASAFGGGLWNGGVLTVTHSTIFGNYSGRGGGLANYGLLTVMHSTILGNRAYYEGAGLMNAGVLTVTHSTISVNSGDSGGGLFNGISGVLTVMHSTISGNRTRNWGGGLMNSGVLTVTLSTILGNDALLGGGLLNQNALMMSHSTVSDNRAFEGGGVQNSGYLLAQNSTFDGNYVSRDGGGLYNSGVANLYNVTISHNVADYDFDRVGTGAGIYNVLGSEFNTRNTLLAVNYLGLSLDLSDCYGLIRSEHSRFTSVPVYCGIVGTSFTTDPNGIGPLADNGGPTLTVALLPGSDAIDAADPVYGCVNYNSVLPTDQRGAPRVAGARCDVGAYEFGSMPGTVGTGTPASCTEAALNAALASGETVTFNCGSAPHTIQFSGLKSIFANTTIDGSGKITLSGQDEHQLFFVDGSATLTLRNLVLTNGFSSGDDGGAIDNNGTLTLETVTIRNSTAGLSGGAIVSTGPLTITNSLLENNQALNGGALYSRFSGARTTIVNSVLQHNHATDTTDGWGGAILAGDSAPVTIQGSDLYSNTARNGGGIFNFPNASVTLNASTLRDNSASNGGGLYNSGTATLFNVTLSGNSATKDGGGLMNAGTAELINVTLSGDTAGSSGGGIYNLPSYTVTLKNSIVAYSPTGGNCGGGPLTNNNSDRYSLSSDNTCALGDPGSQNNTDPLLTALSNYGGSTQVHMLKSGSPAIDGVSGNDAPATDQRGKPRPQGGGYDIGAVERQTTDSNLAPRVYLPLTRK